MKPWRDRSNYNKPPCKCLGCEAVRPRSRWGPWCYDCNVERMSRINKTMAKLARGLGDEEAARELEND